MANAGLRFQLLEYLITANTPMHIFSSWYQAIGYAYAMYRESACKHLCVQLQVEEAESGRGSLLLGK